MKSILFKKVTAIAATSAVLLGTFSINGSLAQNSTAVEDQPETYTLSYNIEGLETEGDFSPLELKAGSAIELCDEICTKEGYTFTGWTVDNIIMYEPGDVFTIADEDVTLQPVLADVKDLSNYNIYYNDEGYDPVDVIKVIKKNPGFPVQISKNVCLRDGYTQIGWNDKTNYYTAAQKIIMPDHDLNLYPTWYKMYDICYEAGDVDNLSGTTSYTFSRMETAVFDLANSSRLSRSGYMLTGWLCDYDNVVYDVVAQFTMPSSDVHFTAVWTPSEYSITFASNTSSKEKIYVNGTYGTSIVLPECPFENSGYTFTGWKYGTTTYQAGEKFEIPALVPGKTIVFGAVWSSNAVADKKMDAFSLLEERQKFNNGEISEAELKSAADFILNNASAVE